jgi:hypothetical protein
MALISPRQLLDHAAKHDYGAPAFIKSLEQMSRKAFRTFRALALALLVAGCDRNESTGEPADPAGSGGFTAALSGAVDAQVSGTGVIRFIAPSESPMGTRPGYFFIADGTGERDFGMTFIIPENAGAARHELVTASPLQIGTACEVRVDVSAKARIESFQNATQGWIQIDQMPADASAMPGHPVKGSFEFTTADGSGRTLVAKGSFDFTGR